MGPYSMDLRQRVATAVDKHEGSLRAVGRRFCVSLSFVARLLRLQRQTGSLVPRPPSPGRPPALDVAGQQRLREQVKKQPDATLSELAQSLGCGLMAVWRTLRKLKISRKKKTLRAKQRDDPEVQKKRQAFLEQMAAIDPGRVVFVDECGGRTDMTRLYGRAPKGERVYGSVPGRWESLTLIAGMRLGQVLAPWTFPGATDTLALATYTEAVLIPELHEGDVLVWDNLKPHKDKEVIDALEQVGVTVLPAPPWSPDLMPIEKMFAKVKGFVRTAAARTKETLIDAFAWGLRNICPSDILGYFQSCGFATQPTEKTKHADQTILDRLKTLARRNLPELWATFS
jgi:transposase